MRRAALVPILAALAVPTLAGCAHSVVVDPAPYAADPDCARVMLAMPDELGGLERRQTTSQATFAFGGDEAVVIARCGVEPPGPTTDECLAVEASSGTQDWVLTETEDAWIAVAFGRSPALELTVPKIRADEAVGDLLAEVSGPAALAPSNGLACR